MITKMCQFVGIIIFAVLSVACSSQTNPAPAAPAPDATLTQPNFDNVFAESNALFDQLEANAPIEVAPANDSAQTVMLTMPTLF